LENKVKALEQAVNGLGIRYAEHDPRSSSSPVQILASERNYLRFCISKNAKVYMIARSLEKTENAIDSIKAATPESSGELIFFRLDLADPSSVKTSIEEFLARERKLHVPFENAGLGYPERGSKSKQVLQLGVNCIGTFALTKQLTSVPVSTAKISLSNTICVVWVSRLQPPRLSVPSVSWRTSPRLIRRVLSSNVA